METERKIAILSESARYDVSCASSGSSGRRAGCSVGACAPAGICHSWSADGRCISLLKVLLTNRCVYDCAFCANRRSNDIPRAAFTVREVVDLTMAFYRRNYIEGLFLSSGIERSPDDTMAQLCQVAEALRRVHGFGGYLHIKAIPGASPALLRRAGMHADRMSVNIELPSRESLRRLAPQKTGEAILGPMDRIGEGIREYGAERRRSRRVPPFVPAGQSTQMVIGASPESDRDILRLSQGLYRKYSLKRVYYSAYIPVNEDSRLPALREPPLLREHRLYQADWLLRLYGFRAEEILTPDLPDLDSRFDPKTGWALRHPEFFPVEILRASLEQLLRVPGIGHRSARRICESRRLEVIRPEDLQRIGVVMKRARFFITVGGHCPAGARVSQEYVRSCLARADSPALPALRQPELFPPESLAPPALAGLLGS